MLLKLCVLESQSSVYLALRLDVIVRRIVVVVVVVVYDDDEVVIFQPCLVIVKLQLAEWMGLWVMKILAKTKIISMRLSIEFYFSSIFGFYGLEASTCSFSLR